MNWIKSSYSSGNGACVPWSKSSYSLTNADCVQWARSSYCGDSMCVEVGQDTGIRLLRDSKDPTGPILQFTEQAAQEFLTGVKAGEFDR